MQGMWKRPSILLHLGVCFEGKDGCGKSTINYKGLIAFGMTMIFLLP